MYPQLTDYIKKSKDQGLSDEQINKNLLSAGWSLQDINSAMGIGQGSVPIPSSVGQKIYNAPVDQPEPKSKHTLLKVLLVVILSGALAGGGYAFYAKQKSVVPFLPQVENSVLNQQTINNSTQQNLNAGDVNNSTIAINQTKSQSNTNIPISKTQTSTKVLIPKTTPTITSKPLTVNTNYDIIQDTYSIQDDGTLILPNDNVDIGAVSRKFYSLYPNKDTYDFLSIFTTFNDPSKPHLHYNAKDNVAGIGKGDGSHDTQSVYGSSKLLGVNFLNGSFTSDQSNASQQLITLNLNILDHETAHQWIMYAGSNFGFQDSEMSHYNRWANTGFIRNGEEWVDTNGGWVWKDNGNGTLTIPSSSFNAKRGFSPLSLYLMGLISSTEVPDLQVVVPQNPNDTSSTTIKGAFKKVSINDIIAKFGPRVPSYQNSQKDFKMAYILLTQKGETTAQYDTDALNFIAKQFPIEWNYITYGNSTINAH